MDTKPIDVSIMLRCSDDRRQLLVMYHDTGITLVRGRRDTDKTFIIEIKEELPFLVHPEFYGLYYDNAWDVQELAALTEQFCWDGSKT